MLQKQHPLRTVARTPFPCLIPGCLDIGKAPILLFQAQCLSDLGQLTFRWQRGSHLFTGPPAYGLSFLREYAQLRLIHKSILKFFLMVMIVPAPDGRLQLIQLCSELQPLT